MSTKIKLPPTPALNRRTFCQFQYFLGVIYLNILIKLCMHSRHASTPRLVTFLGKSFIVIYFSLKSSAGKI